MEEAIKTILNTLGPSGAFLIAMASYLIKKELAFHNERLRHDALIEKRHEEMLALHAVSGEFAKELVFLKNEISELKSVTISYQAIVQEEINKLKDVISSYQFRGKNVS